MSKVQGLISEIKSLSIVETLELVEKLQSEFGVSAASMSMPAQAATVEAVAVKSNFKVELVDVGAEKTKVIKALRVVKKELGLIEAKNATENLPYLVFAESNKEDTDNAKKILEEAGAKIKVS
jgi:large subunit ribosomal protein L7/L12